MTLQRRALGADGEAAVAAWYESQGYEVLARNWSCRDGELDLIVRRARTIAFCEVKTRSSLDFGAPAEAVNHDKRRRLRHLAAKWLDDAPVRPIEIRFDVASVLSGPKALTVEVIEGAF
ncbi:MAG: YraN family protein [Acidimicrobiales bacterium]